MKLFCVCFHNRNKLQCRFVPGSDFMMSECGSRPSHQSCVSSGLCHLQELAQLSKWGQVLEALKDIEDSRCLPVMVERGLQEVQWECVTSLATYCSVQQREVMVQQAASQHQWQCVTDIVKMGVGPTVRNSLLKQVVAGRQVECAACLISLGVCRQDREDSLRQAVDDGDCDFVLGLLDACRDSDMQDFVLREAMKGSWWQLVWGLVKQGLNVGQMESVCDEAVGCRQWDLVLYLLQQGVSASEWIISELFQNSMAQSLLDRFPRESLPDGLKGLLLMTGVRHGQGDIILQIIDKEKVSDTELMEIMKYAVSLQDAKVFLKLIRKSPRSHRIFKQKFHQQDWVDSFQVCDSIGWIFNTLCNVGEHDLALHVAITNKKKVHLIHDYWRIYSSVFNLKKLKFQHALRKIYELDRCVYKELVLAMYQKSKVHRSFLFRQAIRLGEISLTQRFCKIGVEHRDLTYAVPWLVVNNDSDTLNCICSYRKISDRVRRRLNRYAAKCAFREYFNNKSESNLITFIFLFSRCCDKAFRRHMFRLAVAKAVERDDAECFIKVLNCVLDEFSESYNCKDTEDLHFAYLTAIQAGRKHFIAQLCQQSLSVMFYSLKDLIAIEEVVFETKAWDVLPCLSQGMCKLLLHDEDVYKPLNLCLQKMLSERETWSGVAPALEHWIRTVDYGHLQDLLKAIRDSTLTEHWLFSLSSVAQWSLEQRFCNLAFVLALVIDDWNLVETVLNVENLDLREHIHCAAVNLAVGRRFIAISASMLKILPLTSYSVKMVYPCTEDTEPLVNACQNLGLTDWFYVMSVNLWKHQSVTEMLQACSNQVVLDHFMKEAVDYLNWKAVKQLLNHCDKTTILEKTLRVAVVNGEKGIAEAVICRVDPSVVFRGSSAHRTWKTLLYMAVEARSLNLVRLCIASGLSTFQREVVFIEMKDSRDHNCPLLLALWLSETAILKLLLQSGACTHKRLHTLRRNGKMKCSRGYGHMKEAGWKKGYRCMLSAAATPSRLEHLARLVVSHHIGCHPGRGDRIKCLPVPLAIKNLVNFRDVLQDGDEGVTMDQSG